MAELSISQNRRMVPKVDLTAMVDLAFLLITFFMLTTSLSKPVAMDIVKPDKNIDGARLPLPASRTMTILLGDNSKIGWYMGEAELAKPVTATFGEIRKVIQRNKDQVAKANNYAANRTLILIVKPMDVSNYKNFVDIMDEISLAKLNTAPAIDDDHILPSELAFFKN